MDIINTINLIPQHIQKSQEWLNQRKGYLTSSDAATALGINPYEKPVNLLFKKCGEGKPFTGNIATRWGEKYEDEAIDMYCKAMGYKNYEFGLIPLDAVYTNGKTPDFPDSEFLAGSPDGISIPDNDPTRAVLIEVKCPYKRKIKMGYCPEYYYPQVQLNMYICNLQEADFIEYKPDTRGGDDYILNIVHMKRNDEWLRDSIPKLKSFWDSVLHHRIVGIQTHPNYEKLRYKEPPPPVKMGCLIEED